MEVKKSGFWTGFGEYFWPNFWPSLIPSVPIMVVPPVLHLLGLSRASFVFFWGLVFFMGFDVLLRLPRFVKAVRNKNSKPYIGWCIVDWSAYGIALLIGALAAKAVGLI